MQVTCPICGAPGEAGRFCEMGCGRLPAASAAVPAPSAAVPAPPAEPVRPVSVHVPSAVASPQLSMTFPEWVIEGSTERIVFAFSFPRDVYERATVRILDGVEVLLEAKTQRRPGLRGELAANLTPPRAGSFSFTVELCCRRDGEAEDEVLQTVFDMTVKQRPSSINIQQGPINIDAKYGVDMAGARIGTINLPPVDLTPGQRITKPLALDWVRGPHRLLLVAGDEVVQLLAQGHVSCGRHRGNDVALRVFAPPFLDAFPPEAGQRLLSADRRVGGTGFDERNLPQRRGSGTAGVRVPAAGAMGNRLRVVSQAFDGDGACFRRTVMLESGEVPFGAAGERLTWDGGLFAVVTATGERRLLVPGGEQSLDGRTWRVEPFGPTWIHGPGRA